MLKNIFAEEIKNVKQIDNIRELFERLYKEEGDHTSFILKNKIQSEETYLKIPKSQFLEEYKSLGEKLLDLRI